MERERRVPVAAREFWRRFAAYDWAAELAAMECPRLLYAGGFERARAVGLRRTRAALSSAGVRVVEFDGFDHRTCNEEPALSATIEPAVSSWISEVVGLSW